MNTPQASNASLARTLVVMRALALVAGSAAAALSVGCAGPTGSGGGEQCVCNGADASNHAGACDNAEIDAGCATAVGLGPLPPPELA